MRGKTYVDRAGSLLLRPVLSILTIMMLIAAIVPAYAGDTAVSLSNSSVSTYIIVFNDTPQAMAVSVQSTSNLVASYGGQIKYRYNIINGMAITIPDSMADKLNSLPGVEYVQKDQTVHVLLNDSIPLIGADQVWSEGYKGDGVKIAIIDTGVDTSHPDLSNGKVILWKDYTGDSKGVVHTTPYDDYGHGTHVSSIAAGTGAASNGKYTGVAPNASLIEAKVLDYSGSGSDSNIIAAIQWAVDNGAQVISMSLGSKKSDPSLDTAVNNAVSKGVVVVVAAGNSGSKSGTVFSPGEAAGAITVGAVYKNDTIAPFSSRGPTNAGLTKPDVVNIGVSVIAARSSYNGAYNNLGTAVADNPKYMYLSGTSMATPMTTGVVALMLDKNPYLTPAQVKTILENSAKPMGTIPNNNTGFGRVQANYAIDNVTYDASYVSDTIPGSMYPGQSIPVTVTMKNIGKVTWANGTSIYLNGTNDAAKFGTVKFNIPAGAYVPPGESYTWSFTITAPSAQGLYHPTYQVFNGNIASGDLLSKSVNVYWPVLQLNSTSYSVHERDGNATVTVIRTVNLAGTVSVAYNMTDGTAKAGQNYTASNGTVYFGDNESIKTFQVPIIDNNVNGSSKIFNVLLSLPANSILGANSSAMITIKEDDPVPVIQFGAASYFVWENQTNATITVTRSVVTSGTVSAAYNISNGTAKSGLNYTANNGTVDFADGETSKTFNISIIDDGNVNGNKTVNLALANPTNGSILGANKAIILTIIDDDSLSSFSYNLIEGWNMISLPMVLSNDSIDAFFPATVRANLTDMWYYDNGSWDYYSGSQGYSEKYAHLTNVTPGRGYWVNLANNSTFTVYGLNTSVGVPPVGSGWTMFGVEGLGSVNVSSVYPGNQDMWYYSNGQWYYNSATQGYSSKYPHLDTLESGKGYWVNL